jgi:hypothetical protein
VTRFYTTNPSETEFRFCKHLGQTLAPGEVIEVTEATAASILNDGVEFFVGFDTPDWDYYHAPRQRPMAETTSTGRDQ